MEKFEYEKIAGLHLELTNKCNACCAMCSRNFKGKNRKNLKLTELTLSDCKKIMSKDFIKQLKLISLCGVYGDATNASELLSIIDYLYECNENLHIDLYTNGSLHDTVWWSNLAKVIKKGIVIFGIDGIGETHSIHRMYTDFDKIVSNASAFISAGGRAQWDFIVFKHNEHQVDEARELSKRLGFEIFQVKKTSRFFKNLYEKDNQLDSTIEEYGKHPVYNGKGEIITTLELPNNKEYRNKSEDKIFEKIEKYGDLQSYFDNVKINCQGLETGGVFISCFGEVFPCCTVYQQVCYKTINEVSDESELNEYNYYVGDNLSAFNRPIKEIVESEFFNSIVESWTKKSIKEGKCKSCSRTCGMDYNSHKEQHTVRI